MTSIEKLKKIVDGLGICYSDSYDCDNCPIGEGIEHCTPEIALKLAKDKLAKLNSIFPFKRDEQIIADGKKWRVDWVDGPFLGLSSDDGCHKGLHKDVCKLVIPGIDYHTSDHDFDGIVTP